MLLPTMRQPCRLAAAATTTSSINKSVVAPCGFFAVPPAHSGHAVAHL